MPCRITGDMMILNRCRNHEDIVSFSELCFFSAEVVLSCWRSENDKIRLVIADFVVKL